MCRVICSAAYIEELDRRGADTRSVTGLTTLRAEVVRMLRQDRGVLLTDGREVQADIVVLAMGNLAPRPPGGGDPWVYDTGYFVPDPWARDAFHDVHPDETLLLIGAGLTMVDVTVAAGGRGASREDGWRCRAAVCCRSAMWPAVRGRNFWRGIKALRRWH